MFHQDIPFVNFTISDNAKRGIELVRQAHDVHSSDPAAVPWIGWGRFMPNSGPVSENVVVGFYGQSELPKIAEAIQMSGFEIFFFANTNDYPRFEGKVLDFADDRGFFLTLRNACRIVTWRV